MEKKYHTFYKIIGILRDSFYKTRDPAPLMQELSNAGIEFPSDMITVEELEGGNMGGVEPVKEGKSEEEDGREVVNSQGGLDNYMMPDEPVLNPFLMEENYEEKLRY